jgi:hypothetical protein
LVLLVVLVVFVVFDLDDELLLVLEDELALDLLLDVAALKIVLATLV